MIEGWYLFTRQCVAAGGRIVDDWPSRGGAFRFHVPDSGVWRFRIWNFYPGYLTVVYDVSSDQYEVTAGTEFSP